MNVKKQKKKYVFTFQRTVRFANNTVYVGLSYYGPVMGSDEYFSFFLSGLVEIPGYLLCWAVMDRWGRRWPLCLVLIIYTNLLSNQHFLTYVLFN